MCGIIGVTGESDAIPHPPRRPAPARVPRLRLGRAWPWWSTATDGSARSGGPGRPAARTRWPSSAELTADAPTGHAAAIGHTRWATHGGPTAENAHPHIDCTGRLALIHNGIIENHAELRAELVAAGHTLTSATDTEVMAHLIEAGDGRRRLAGRGDPRRAADGCGAPSPSRVISADEPDTIVAARRKTPLVLGLQDGVAFLASDIPALIGHTREVFALADDELAVLTPGALDGHHARRRRRSSPSSSPSPGISRRRRRAASRTSCPRRSTSSPQAVADTLLDRRGPGGELILDEMRLSADDLRDIDKVFIVACGSSYHAALVAKYAIEHWVKLPTEVDIASEFRYRDPVLNERTLCVGVSQSGETLDTSEAMREAARLGAKVLVVSNVVDSSMARAADGVLYTRAGPEIGVASTKCHLAQIVALEVLGLYLAQILGTRPASEINEILERHGGPAPVWSPRRWRGRVTSTTWRPS